MDGSPPHAPTRPGDVALARALAWASRLQERAAGVGFDWPDARGPLAKVHEELGELAAALPPEGGDPPAARAAVEDEIGDLLFAVVNLARKLGVDPRAALERATAKFRRRFEELERLAAQRGMDVARASLDVLDRLWDEVKAGEGPGE
jgi:uncharacterized protein YabN with tetrapyrrole methylase and pyrophosphatase domain